MKSLLSRLAVGAAIAGLFAAATLAPAAAAHHRRHYHHYHHGRDTVSSLFVRGHGYGHNRVSGQRYHKCTMDLGYGRTEPCDAGGNR